MNSVIYKASVFVTDGKKWLTIEKALAYCTTELITTVKFYDTDPWSYKQTLDKAGKTCHGQTR